MTAAKQKTTELYQLDPAGKACQSALALYRLFGEAFDKNPILMEGRNLGEIGKDWAAFYRNFYAETQAKHPNLLQDTGLMSPATQVKTYNDGFARAYLSYPTIYLSDYAGKDGKPLLYLYAPVDYKGDHFKPEGAKILNAKQTAQVGNRLFAGGWSSPASVFPMPEAGVATPEDFNAEKHRSLNGSYKADRTTVCFIAQGRSLECVEDLARRKEEWTNACDTVTEALKAAVPLSYAPAVLARIALGEEFYINSGQR